MRKRMSAGVIILLALGLAPLIGAPARAAEPPGQRWGLPEESGLYAISPPNIFYHNVGLLELMITNVGIIGNPNFVDSYGAGWRGGEYLYAASLWVGAIAPDNLPYVTTGAYEVEFRPSLDDVDTIYPSYEGAPHGNRPGFSTQPDDDNDGLVDEDPLNGRDDDGDGPGVGRPCGPGVAGCDEDYSAISQQMFSCQYWDYTQESTNRYPEHRPLNLRVHQESYAWSTEGSNEFIGFEFKIYNDGFEVLRSLYIGFFVDSDAGPKEVRGFYGDDGGSFYSEEIQYEDASNRYTCRERDGSDNDCSVQDMKLDICYMYDIRDNGADATGGDVDGNFGGMFLGHTTDPFGERAPTQVGVHTAIFFSGSGAYPSGDPRNDFERYDLLSRGQRASRPTGSPSDYRYCFSAGPFRELAPGDVLQFQTAFVIGRGFEQMKNNAINAQRIYNGAWRDVDGNTSTGRGGSWPVGGRETCLFVLDPTQPLIWRDPCDSLSPQTIQVKDTVCLPQNYVDDDCTCCTPLYRTNEEAEVQGYETLIRWVGTVAPPPPGTNIDPISNPAIQVTAPGGDRRVILQWDNLSELSADPIQRKVLFTGYRVWRVEGWSRPIGSTGPSPGDWQLIADISKNPPDRLGRASPYHISKYVCRPDGLTRCIGPDSFPEPILTGSEDPNEDSLYYYPVGRYRLEDTLGLKNGMVYFYDVTAYSSWTDSVSGYQELAGRPTAAERDGVVPQWQAANKGGSVYVVPNPYVRGGQPLGWDLTPSDRDPTGTKIAFANLPLADCRVKIYTLAGDLVQTLEKDCREDGSGTVFWNLISRRGQDIVSGVYLYSVECRDCPPDVKGCGNTQVGRFTVIR